MIFRKAIVQRNRSKPLPIGIGLLISTYLAGLAGIAAEIHPYFIRLTPFSLLLSLVIILLCTQLVRKKLLYFAIFTFIWGYTMEVVGVNTGFPFGEYAYGEVFGYKVFDTPLLIGVNWFLVAYGTGVLLNTLVPSGDWAIKVFFGAYFMVILDILIEPIAIQYDFWSWENGHPPVENYLGWFFVSLPPMAYYFWLWPKEKDTIGLTFIIMQYVFFIGLHIF